MRQPAHTPGPWHTHTSEIRGHLCVVSDGSWICGEIYNQAREMPRAEAEANARLIAAAPQFYEAAMLRRAYEALPADRGGGFGPKGRARAAWLDVEESAIAKTEGR